MFNCFIFNQVEGFALPDMKALYQSINCAISTGITNRQMKTQQDRYSYKDTSYMTGQWKLVNFSISGRGPIGIQIEKNKIGLLSYTIYKNQFQMDYKSKCERQNY